MNSLLTTIVIAFTWILLAANTASARSLVIAENHQYDFVWFLDAQVRGEYKIVYKNFETKEPLIFIFDTGELSFSDLDDVVTTVSERYSDCMEIQFEKEKNTIVISPKKLVHVKSKHIEQSTYEVKGQEPFSLITNNESKSRYFCLFRPDLIESEWQKRALLNQ